MSTTIKYVQQLNMKEVLKNTTGRIIFLKYFKLQMLLLTELLKEILCLGEKGSLKWSVGSTAFRDKKILRMDEFATMNRYFRKYIKLMEAVLNLYLMESLSHWENKQITTTKENNFRDSKVMTQLTSVKAISNERIPL